jgi:hypothetical protein
MTRTAERYLGDGVYASFDGWHIVLDLRAQAVSGHVCEIALDADILDELDEYRRYLKEAPAPQKKETMP